MRFKPVTSKYVFDNTELIRDFPSYLQLPIASWTAEVLKNGGIWTHNSYNPIDHDFLNELDLRFRERFPRDSNEFLGFVLADPERTVNMLALCLQNYALTPEARNLEHILATGGSAYAVMFMSNDPKNYDRGVSDIVERVPEVVRESSHKILDANELLRQAWHSCYSKNPDYEKTVNKAVDALEGLFKQKYFPADSMPSLGKFVKAFETNPKPLSFHGDSLLNAKNYLTKLAENFIPIRGHHTSGTGRAPTKEEAVFVLHYAIFVFQLHT